MSFQLLSNKLKQQTWKLVQKNLRIHHRFCRFCRYLILRTQSKFVGVQFNTEDLLCEPITPETPETISIYSRKQNGFWLFTLQSLQKIFQNHLLTDIPNIHPSLSLDDVFETIDLHPHPTQPKNPYNNKIFNYQQLTQICQQFRAYPKYYKKCIQYYELSQFSTKQFKADYRQYLIHHNISHIPNQLSINQLYLLFHLNHYFLLINASHHHLLKIIFDIEY